MCSHDFNLTFNATKTVNVAVSNKQFSMPNVFIDGKATPWVCSLKYLGVRFNGSNVLEVDSSSIKRRFYASHNSILNRCKLASEPVKVQLIRSFCLPHLCYYVGALDLSDKVVQQLSVCWNDAFRQVFSYKRYESVKQLQYFCGKLPFLYMHDTAKWNFYSKMCSSNIAVIQTLCKVLHVNSVIRVYCDKYMLHRVILDLNTHVMAL